MTKTFSWIAQSGLYTIKAVADPGNQVTESNETNNEKTAVFSVLLPPAPAPAPAPGAEPPAASAEKPAPAPPPEEGIWPGWWLIAALVILGGIIAMAKLKSR